MGTGVFGFGGLGVFGFGGLGVFGFGGFRVWGFGGFRGGRVFRFLGVASIADYEKVGFRKKLWNFVNNSRLDVGIPENPKTPKPQNPKTLSPHYGTP